jgi:uncharacterized protein
MSLPVQQIAGPDRLRRVALGNCMLLPRHDIARLPDALVLDIASAAPLRILLTHIAVYGPKLRAPVARMAQAEGATLIICGHSHVPFIGVDRVFTMFNPTSIGPRRFLLPIVFCTVDVTPAGVKPAHVDVKTTARWLPP